MNAPSIGRVWDWGRGQWRLGHRPFVVGIINVTPDSFSDGGRYAAPDAAVAHGEQLLADGADALDIGAESSRPWAYQPVTVEEEWARLAPVLRRLRARTDYPLSVDTQKAEIARRALAEGADIINDVWGGARDPAMAGVIAKASCGYVMMFNRESEFPPGAPDWTEVDAFFRSQVTRFQAAGVGRERILVDPGIGFGYAVADNWRVLRRLKTYQGLGAGVWIGPSRKRFLGAVTGQPPAERDAATVAVVALAVAAGGVDVVRVHAVRCVRDAAAVAAHWQRLPDCDSSSP